MMRRLNLSIIAWPCIHSGGAERWWYYIIKELRKLDIEITLLIPTRLRLGCLKCPQELEGANVIVKHLPLHRSIRGALKGLQTLLHEIRARSVDIVISGYQTPLITLLTTLIGTLTGRKCLIMFHTSLGWIPYYSQVHIPVKNRLLISLYKLINKKCRFIMVSPSIFYDHRRINFKHNNAIALSGAAVEVPPYVRCYKRPEEREYDVIYLASISKAKGVLDVPRVLKIMESSMEKVKAVIIGKMPKELKKELEAELVKLGRRIDVEVLGFVNGIRKFELLSNSKVMIYPSYIDTFAISVLEALAVGTPVVAYSIPAISVNYKTEAVRKVPIGRVDKMADEVVRLLRDRMLLSTLSIEALNFAKRFSWGEIAMEFLRGLIS